MNAHARVPPEDRETSRGFLVQPRQHVLRLRLQKDDEAMRHILGPRVRVFGAFRCGFDGD